MLNRSSSTCSPEKQSSLTNVETFVLFMNDIRWSRATVNFFRSDINITRFSATTCTAGNLSMSEPS